MAVEVEVLGFQVVLGSTMDRGGELCDGIAEPTVAQVELCFAARPPQVQPAWLLETRWTAGASWPSAAWL